MLSGISLFGKHRAQFHNISHKLAAAGRGARNKAIPCGISTEVFENEGLWEQKGIKNIPDDLMWW